MTQWVLHPTVYAYGGSVVARDAGGRPIFVQGALPEETVEVTLTDDKKRFAHGYTTAIVEASPQRVAAHCPHYGPCGGCQYQHVIYSEQLKAKRLIVADQLRRIGGISDAPVLPTIASPSPWAYAHEAVFSPVDEGAGLGYWSSRLQEVIPVETCPITRDELIALFDDVDLDLPGLRKLTLRVDSDGSMLAALEVDDVEPPELSVDFPLSVSIVLPGRTAASLIGEPYLLYRVKEHTFRVSPGCFFHPNLAVTEQLIDTVLEFSALSETDQVLELFSGVGLLTAFMAEQAAEITAVEFNSDAVDDMIANLNHLENVTLYHGLAEEILPVIADTPDVLVVDPGPNGLAMPLIERLSSLAPRRLVYVGSDLARMARDSKSLAAAGFALAKVQPLDMRPQTYHIDTVSLWLA